MEFGGLKIGFFDSTVASLSAKGIDDGVAEVEQVVGIVVGESLPPRVCKSTNP